MANGTQSATAGDPEFGGRSSEVRSGFWSFNLGHAITISLMIVSVIGLYFKVDSRLSAVELLAASTSMRLERIDEQGTRKSQLGLSQDIEMVRANTNRIQELEKVVGSLTPKIERIDVNLEWLISQQPNGPKKPVK